MFLSTVFVLLAFLYYSFFVNKGIVLYDEGYYLHIAERISNGEVPYKDFFLQFSPGYFYVLAFLYKIFGSSVIIGRYLTLVICLLIIFLTFLILDKLKVKSNGIKILSFFSITSFGFPLINNPSTLAWAIVLISLGLIYSYTSKKFILVGIFLSLTLFFKQNLGLYFFIITNIFLVLTYPKDRVIALLKTNGVFLSITLIWIFYFFYLQSNLDKLIELFEFNKRYLSIYSFSYPPLTMLSDPLGVFKLMPYYAPILFLLLFIKGIHLKNKNISIIYFSCISLVGFAGTIFPTSDLLHVYPFFGIFLVSSLIFLYKDKAIKFWIPVVIILIFIGFYLALYMEYYRYQPPYRFQNTMLNLPRTQNIHIDKSLNEDLNKLSVFLSNNTSSKDYILSYPFSPMLYFILERNNPSRFSIYYPGYLTKDQEEEVLREISNKKVKYIITFLDNKFNRPISRFIQNQDFIFKSGQFSIYKIN